MEERDLQGFIDIMPILNEVMQDDIIYQRWVALPFI